MDFDIELVCSKDGAAGVHELVEKLPAGTIVTRGIDKALHLRTDQSEQEKTNLADSLNCFLELLAADRSTLRSLNGTLRVGVFFRASDLAYVPVTLPHSLVATICNLGLTLSINYYPCSDEENP
ncbi:MAG: hypothetical protein ACREYA_12510 [Cupriavidus necator]